MLGKPSITGSCWAHATAALRRCLPGLSLSHSLSRRVSAFSWSLLFNCPNHVQSYKAGRLASSRRFSVRQPSALAGPIKQQNLFYSKHKALKAIKKWLRGQPCGIVVKFPCSTSVAWGMALGPKCGPTHRFSSHAVVASHIQNRGRLAQMLS